MKKKQLQNSRKISLESLSVVSFGTAGSKPCLCSFIVISPFLNFPLKFITKKGMIDGSRSKQSAFVGRQEHIDIESRIRCGFFVLSV